MDENRNNRAVERKLKDALKTDRARIQVGRISHFGLLEMSRQRMRSGVLEGSTVQCLHCLGTGLVRSVESMALHVLRGVEAEAIKGRAAAFTVKVPVEVAVYILNQKRANLLDIEERYGTSVYIEADPLLKGSEHLIEPAEARALTRARPAQGAINIETAYTEEEEPVVEEVVEEAEEESEEIPGAEPRARGGDGDEEEGPRRKRRRRRRRGGRREDGQEPQGTSAPLGETRAEGGEPDVAGEEFDEDEEEETAQEGTGASAADGSEAGEGGDRPRKRRRRGRRGGRRNRRPEDGIPIEGSEGPSAEAVPADEAPFLLSYSRDDLVSETAEHVAAEEIQPEEAISRQVASKEETPEAHAAAATSVMEAIPEEAPARAEPVPDEASLPVETTEEPDAALAPPQPVAAAEPEKPQGPSRRGWWQRRSG